MRGTLDAAWSWKRVDGNVGIVGLDENKEDMISVGLALDTGTCLV